MLYLPRRLGAEGLDSFRHTKLAMVDYGRKAQGFYRNAESFTRG